MREIKRVMLGSASALAVVAGGAAAQEAGFLYRTLEADGTYRMLSPRGTQTHSVAREWNEVLLEAIRHDKARPTVHGRNLFHTSAAMWDAWAAYDDVADQVFHHERQTAADVHAAREEAISYAMYRLLIQRFENSVGAADSLPLIHAKMADLGYDAGFTSLVGDTPAALGNRIANTVIQFGLSDGSNEQGGYGNLFYTAVNLPLFPDFPGNPDISDPNRWQPLAIEFFVDQSGNPIPLGSLEFLSPEWGIVEAFAIDPADVTMHPRDGFPYPVCHDPGPPPLFQGEGDAYYRWGNEMVALWSGHLDPSDGVLVDISPNSFGNSPLPGVNEWEQYYDWLEGGDWSQGHDINPATGMPYPQQVVPRGDYTRILAEFWADGPASETPPGHWFTILNYVNDHPLFEKRFRGVGPVLEDLEWDVKSYLLLGGGMHDVAVAAWGCKGAYDYVRPISAIRFLADNGQSSDPNQLSYNPDGITLVPDRIEVVTAESSAPGQRHAHLGAGSIGKIAIKAWRGPLYIADPETDEAGVGWILVENWWPYQRPSFVTPPFAGYVSGHSTFSRFASELMTDLTGSEFFPGGVGEFFCPMNEFLVFEEGPSQDIVLQWATYRDASDQTSMSRIWGGIHPPADDIPGRHMGIAVEEDTFRMGVRYFHGSADCPGDVNGDELLSLADVIAFVNAYMDQSPVADYADPWEVFDAADVNEFIGQFLGGCQ